MHLRSFKRVACALMGALLTVGSAYAKGPEPALWRIKHGDATVYLFGSVHILPRYWEWRTPAIDKAMAASDAFVFESLMTPEALGKMRVFLRENGTLPRGKHLSQMLSPQGLEDYKAALQHTPIDPDSINVMRPWLAQIVLADFRIEGGPNRSSYGEGADFQIEADARRMKKPVRYLESVESVFKILVQAAPDNDLKQFEANLHSLREGSKEIDRLVDRWTAGDQPGLTRILADDAANHPEEMRMVLNVRNHNWMPQIEGMLASKQTIFITMGAAHLVGPESIMDMLCQRGWKVERIQTGSTTPPAACAGVARPKAPPVTPKAPLVAKEKTQPLVKEIALRP